MKIPIRASFRVLGTPNVVRMVARANVYVSAALIAYDAYEIGSCMTR
jgi:hypothetical protein